MQHRIDGYMPPGPIIPNFKPTSLAINNVESRAGIGRPRGAALSGVPVAGSATAASVISAPNETGDLL